MGIENFGITPQYESKDEKKIQARNEKLAEDNISQEVKSFGAYFDTILSNKSERGEKAVFGETIEKNSEGGFDISNNYSKHLLFELARHINTDSNSIREFFAKVGAEYPMLEFSITDNTNGFSYEIRLKGNLLGKKVQWINQGATQWEEPRKVIGLSDDKKWAFVEGSKTGIPLDQLEEAA